MSSVFFSPRVEIFTIRSTRVYSARAAPMTSSIHGAARRSSSARHRMRAPAARAWSHPEAILPSNSFRTEPSTPGGGPGDALCMISPRGGTPIRRRADPSAIRRNAASLIRTAPPMPALDCLSRSRHRRQVRRGGTPGSLVRRIDGGRRRTRTVRRRAPTPPASPRPEDMPGARRSNAHGPRGSTSTPSAGWRGRWGRRDRRRASRRRSPPTCAPCSRV